MKRARVVGLILLGLLACSAIARADRANSYSTRAERQLDRALSAQALFGIPTYTAATLPACTALLSKGAPIAYVTDSAVVQVCNGTSWSSTVFGGGLTIGTTPITGGTDKRVLYNNNGVLGNAANQTYDGTSTTFGGLLAAANTVSINAAAGCIRFEGSTADAIHADLCMTDPTTGSQTFNLPNRNSGVTDTIATLGSGNTFTTVNNFNAGLQVPTGQAVNVGGGLGFIVGRTALTPDAPVFETTATSNSYHIAPTGGNAFDYQNGRCGTAACGDPALITFSRNQNTTQYVQLSSQNATGLGELQTNLADVAVGGSKTAITEASAVSIIRVGIPTSTNVYGMTVFYTVYDINGANYVARTGSVKVQGGNSGGTATCTINTTQDQETEDGSQIATSNAATLTYTWTNAATTTNCDLQLNAASSEGVNTYAITWNAVLTGNSSSITITPQ